MQVINGEPKKIAVVNKHALTRSGFMHLVKSLGRYEVTVQVDCIESLGYSIGDSPVDILVTDLFGSSDAINAHIKAIYYYHELYPATHIIVYTSMQDQIAPLFSRDIAKLSVISRMEPLEDIYHYIELALSGVIVVSPKISNIINESLEKHTLRPINLTHQENEVLSFYLGGMNVTQIARIKKRSIKTISAQKCSGMRKLGACSDADLFLYKKRYLKSISIN
ncbi:LuxR C-terminal-related transcriptional regulator [Serratia fonticola]|uniref:LuxR C-terminal-related transcriptional regulator n=1 Tax=Serratia fonticola TaxID=47917 RepID=UPI0027F7D6CD|nr:LuxR C-terminal-related transcriptional regulator [Serratia fonticola]MDQ7212047.1 LuxR C-terminal-related transcriptional regulator [Serratia fonticola]HBE9082898.1 response regulator transcription factor [Serratia fonticola]HBE9093387.1 response regulator transcription factor [Serratia fonticola]HBE9155750.1 response regulator transcription factor [Serratia fonticola]